MYLINIRQNGGDGDSFRESEQLFYLTPNGKLEYLDLTDLIREVKQKNILLLIHGFNQSVVDVLSFYLTLQQKYQKFIEGYYKAIVGYIWPGGEGKFSYNDLAKQQARTAGHRVQNLIKVLNRVNCTVDVMTHATGSLVLYNALQTHQSISVRNYFSLGAALFSSVLKDDINLDKAFRHLGNIYIFYTRSRGILKYEFAFSGNRSLPGYSGFNYWQEEVIGKYNVTLIDCSELFSHSSGDQSLLSIAHLIQKILSGNSPPKRTKLVSGV